LLSPRIRYNIHDAGGILAFDAALAILRDFGLDPDDARTRPDQPLFRLPLLYLFGRSDSTISYMGANIYPEDVDAALYADPADARRLGAFCLEIVDDGDGQRPCVHVEVVDGPVEDVVAIYERLPAARHRRRIEHLVSLDRDQARRIGRTGAVGVVQPAYIPTSVTSGRRCRRRLACAACRCARCSIRG
jgi:phenylacetate-CoA ligase